MGYDETLKSLADELVKPERHFILPYVREKAPFHVSKLAVAQSLPSLPDNVFIHPPIPDNEPPATDALAA